MRAGTRGVWVALLFALSACRPDTIDLHYRFEEGATITYRMDAHARASWDIDGPGTGSYDVSFEVTEEIRSSDEDGALVEVQMSPLDSTEEGLPSPGLESRSFTLQLGVNGEVVRVIEVNGITAAALDPQEVAFIGTYRPALAAEPVRLHDSWTATQELSSRAAPQQIETTGTLDALGRDADGEIALIDFEGAGPLFWSTGLPQGQAALEGSGTTFGRAVVDIGGGFLRRGSSTTIADFEVRIAPTGGRAPIRGTLHLELRLTVRQTSSG